MAGIAHVITSDSASGAQVIDGSLKFDQTKQTYLTRTPGSAGNRKLWTLSYWIKFYGDAGHLFSANNDAFQFELRSTGQLLFANSGSTSSNTTSTSLFRDYSQFYHVVIQHDAANTIARFYINGEQNFTATLTNADGTWNNATSHNINGRSTSIDSFSSFGMSQVYFVDGQALEPSEFGFTDPLTNTWKPKKYTGTFGTNGFYLPMDGNSPIGQDKSGNGNDWTSVNFGASVSLDKATGAKPILNTTPGGNSAAVGVFGSRQNVGYAVTVYNDGGGNKYYIDGVKQDTVTGLIRGATYTFDTSDSTVSSHPFRFSATSNGSHGGGSEYTNGVAAITGAATTITVPYNAPETLYYYCTAHSGMGADITGITTNEKLADQYASHCVLALPLVGNNEDVSASIACTSTKKVMTTEGNAYASGNASQFYGGSFEFDGTGDGITTPDNTDFEFGAGDFTVECWVKQDDTSGFDQFVGKYGGSSDGEFIVGKNGNTPTFYWQDSGGNNNINATNFRAPSSVGGLLDAWYHMACVRKGDVFTMYINGICENSTTDATTIKTTSNKLTVGVENDLSSSAFDGYLQDVRIYKGVAKYSGTTIGTQYFFPPSKKPEFMPDTPSGVSGGSKLVKIVDGSTAFTGIAGTYLSLADSDDFDFGSGDFTVEAFIEGANGGDRIDSVVLNQSVISASSNSAFYFGAGNTGTSLYLSTDGSSWTNYIECAGLVHNSGWHHIAWQRRGDVMEIYVDGIKQTVASGSNSGDAAITGSVFNSSRDVDIGRQSTSGSDFLGHISNLRVIKGTALYTSNFTPPSAPLTNVTNTKLLCCQSNISATEAAVSPGSITANGGAVANTFNPFNTDINTVRGQETGYATLNPLSHPYSASGDTRIATTSRGNLTHDGVSSYWGASFSTIPLGATGKYYFETIPHSGSNVVIGVGKYLSASGNRYWDQGTGTQTFFYSSGGNIVHNSTTLDSGPASYTARDVIGFAIDCDNNEGKFFKNGVLQATVSMPADVITAKDAGTVFPFCDTYNGPDVDWNFGQYPFKFPPPDGFSTLTAAATRPVNVISRPDQYVGVTTYTGDNSASKKIDDLLFSPDLVWVKDRQLNFTHFLNDTVRGAGKILQSNTTTVETDNSDTIAAFPSFDPNGFTVGTNSNWQMNGNNEPYVGWCWKAGGSKNTFNVDDVGYASASAAGLTAGTLTISGASVGTKQGFSIIKYAGSGSDSTFPHGLTQAPNFYMIKCLDVGAESWRVYHSSTTADYALTLNTTAAASDSNIYFSDTEPTSTVASVYAGYDGVNNTGRNYIAYLWHNVPGLQKFGSYEGNQSTDGPFVELGFQPAIIWLKNADDGSNRHWCVVDATRTKINKSASAEVLFLDDAQVESYANNNYGQFGTKPCVDILSNGFKVREGDTSGVYTQTNRSNTIIYCAWAEAPTVDLYGGGANAR